MTYHRDIDAWQGDPADDMEETPEPTEGVRLAIHESYPGHWSATDLDNYGGPGDILGSGNSAVEAAADWAEQHGERCYVRAMTEAYDEISALGGMDRTRVAGSKQHREAGYNAAIDDALELLVKRGALTVQERIRRNSR